MSGGVSIGSIVASVAGAVVSSALTRRSSSQQQQQAQAPEPVAPKIEAPTEMPGINDQERRAASRRSIADQMARRGRASTILTDQSDAKLGG